MHGLLATLLTITLLLPGVLHARTVQDGVAASIALTDALGTGAPAAASRYSPPASVLPLLGSLPPLAPADRVAAQETADQATLETRQPEVQWTAAGTEDWQSVPVRQDVRAGGRVRTGAGAAARLVYFEGTITELGPNTGLLVQRLESSAGGNIVSHLFQAVGTTVSRVVQLVDPGATFEIETPAATAIVRGTTPRVAVAADGTTDVDNIPDGTGGLVTVVGKDPAATSVTLNPGETTHIVPGQPPSSPQPITVPAAASDQALQLPLQQQQTERQQRRQQQQAQALQQAAQAQAGLIATESGLAQLQQQEANLAQQLQNLLGGNPQENLPPGLAPDGNGPCATALGQTCPVSGDLTGSTGTAIPRPARVARQPVDGDADVLGSSEQTAGSLRLLQVGPVPTATATPTAVGAQALGMQWRIVVPAGRIPLGAIATVAISTTVAVETFSCPPPAAGPTTCTGTTMGVGRQGGSVRLFLNQRQVSQSSIVAASSGVTPTITPTPTATTVTGPARVVATERGLNRVVVFDPNTTGPLTTIAVGADPFDVALNPTRTRAYVVNRNGGSVSVLDLLANTVIATIPVANRPQGIAVTPDGRRVYVTSLGNDTVSVIDATTNTVVTTIAFPAQSGPYGIAINPAGTRAYVTNNGLVIGPAQSALSVVDTTTNTILTTVPVGQFPAGVAVSPNGSRVYVTSLGNNTLEVIDATTNTAVATVPVGVAPNGVAVNPAGTRVYVANETSNSISVINATTNSVITTVPLTPAGLVAPLEITYPARLSVDATGSRVFIADEGSATISVLDTSTNTLVSTVRTQLSGLTPFGITVSPSGADVYVTGVNSDTITKIDAATNTVTSVLEEGALGGRGPTGVTVAAAVNRIYTANSASNNVAVSDATTLLTSASNLISLPSPFRVAANPAGTRVYVANQFSGSVSVIDTSSNAVVATVPVGANPGDLVVNPAGTRVYVANLNNNTVSVINTATNAVVATIPVANRPRGVAVNPAGTRLYVVNTLSNSVSVVDTATNTVLTNVPVGTTPTEVAVDTTGARAYVVTGQNGGTVDVIDTATNTVTASVAVGLNPFDIAASPTIPRVYVTNLGTTSVPGNTVSVIDTTTNQVIRTIEIGTAPQGIAARPLP